MRYFLAFNQFLILTVAGAFTTALSAFGFRVAGAGAAEGGSVVVEEGEEGEADEECGLLIWGVDIEQSCDRRGERGTSPA